MTSPSDPAVTLEELLGHDAFLRSLARRLIGGERGAEDAVQETWMKTLRRPPRDAATARSWLARVTGRFVLMERRAGGRRRARERAAARPEEVPSVEEIARREEIRREVLEAVLALEEAQRAALLLRYWRGLEPRRIAATLGVPVETVRTRIRRGCERLRERLDGLHGRDFWPALLAPFALEGLAAAPAAGLGPAILAAALVVAAAGAGFWILGAPGGGSAGGAGGGPPRPPDGQKAAESRSGTAGDSGRDAAGAPRPIGAVPFGRPEEREVSGVAVEEIFPGDLPTDDTGRLTTLVARIVDDLGGAAIAGTEARFVAELTCPMSGRDGVLGSANADEDGWIRAPLAPLGGGFAGTLFTAPGFGPAFEFGPAPEFPVRLQPGLDVPVEIVGEGGAPVPGARVELILGCGHTLAVRTESTGADGRATLRCVTPGLGDLWVIAPGFRYGYESFHDWRRGLPPQRVQLARGPVYEGVVVQDGRPVPGAFVGAPERHRGPWTRADADGRFRLSGAPGGAYLTVRIDEAKGAREWAGDALEDNGPAILTLGEDELSIALDPSRPPGPEHEDPAPAGDARKSEVTLRGGEPPEESPARTRPALRILEPDGAPARDCRVRVTAGGAVVRLETDAEGFATGEPLALESGARFRVACHDCLPVHGALDGAGPWTVILPPGVAELRFRDRAGEPVADVEVLIGAERYDASAGALTLRAIPPGQLRALVTAPGRGTRRFDLHVPADRPLRAALLLDDG